MKFKCIIACERLLPPFRQRPDCGRCLQNQVMRALAIPELATFAAGTSSKAINVGHRFMGHGFLHHRLLSGELLAKPFCI